MGPRLSVWLLLLLAALLLHEERSRAAAKVSSLRAALPSLPPCIPGAPRGLFVQRLARSSRPALEGIAGGTARCILPPSLALVVPVGCDRTSITEPPLLWTGCGRVRKGLKLSAYRGASEI